MSGIFAPIIGLVFWISWVVPGAVQGDPSSPAVPAASVNYLQIHTGAGENLKARVQSFKGLSLSVLATLQKQGKLTGVHEPNSDPQGYMTFILTPEVSADWANWAKSQAAQKDSSGATGEFAWVDSKGKVAETFMMSRLRVIQFIPSTSGGPNGGQIILSADTQAIPPIHFKPQK